VCESHKLLVQSRDMLADVDTVSHVAWCVFHCRSKVRSPDERTYGSLRLNVKRQSVFEDSFNKLRSKAPAEMRAKLSVSFVGEEGIDAGGVSREWYQVRQGVLRWWVCTGVWVGVLGCVTTCRGIACH
jgi:hypothetical protein